MNSAVPRPGREAMIQAGDVSLPGEFAAPAGSHGVVVFAHGSGSGRHSPRNRSVAAAIQEGGLGTLLLDLLTEAEAENRRNVFDIDLLAGRLAAAVEFVASTEPGAPIGLFGASTGAGAALVAAAREPRVGAVVSRGGRPDLAARHLARVTSPTLLIVGGLDQAVLEMNRRALAALSCERELAVVPGAGHLFEEPGAMEEVSRLALEWFVRHLRGGPP